MTQSGIDRFMELAEEGREIANAPKGLGFTADDARDLQDAKQARTIRTVFAAAATGLSATAAYFVIKDPQAVADILTTSGEAKQVTDFSILRHTYMFTMIGIVSGLLTTPLWGHPHRKINDKLARIWERQNERARDIAMDKLDKAEKSFMRSLTYKSAKDLTQADYDMIALVSTENKTLVTDAVQYRRVFDAEILLGEKSFAHHLKDNFAQTKRPEQNDLTNSFWLFPTLATFTAPLLAFVSSVISPIPSAAELDIDEPKTPDLNALKASILKEAAQERAKPAPKV